MSTLRQRRLERAQLQTLFRAPFFAQGVARLPVVWYLGPDCPTAQTDGKEIRWNPAWFDSLPDAVLPTVLCHEVCHLMLGHLWRCDGREHDAWNVACDHATNLMLKEFSALQMSRNLADPVPFPDPQDAYCADPQYAGLSEEAIYAKLPKRSQGPQNALGGVLVASGPSKSPVGGKASGSGDATGAPSAHSMPDFGQFQPQVSSSETKKLQNDWEAVLIQAAAAMAASGYGRLPGSLQRLVNGLVSPVVPWPQVLRSWLREQCADDWDWLQPALEYDGSGFILPSLRSERMGPVVFGSDWSGSTWGDLVDKFHAEKQGCLDDMRPRKLVDIAFDTRVISVREYVPGDSIDPMIRGGGGTSFIDLFRHCEEMNPAPRCVVVLTDLCGEFPVQAPSMPVIWVTWEKGGKAPFGQVIYAE